MRTYTYKPWVKGTPWNGKHTCFRDLTRERHYRRFDHICGWCMTPMSDEPKMRSLDHLEPRDTGGTNAPTNVMPAHTLCNTRRGAKPWLTYSHELHGELAPLHILWVIEMVSRPLPK